jgi:hypothetical protein
MATNCGCCLVVLECSECGFKQHITEANRPDVPQALGDAAFEESYADRSCLNFVEPMEEATVEDQVYIELDCPNCTKAAVRAVARAEVTLQTDENGMFDHIVQSDYYLLLGNKQ